MRTDGNLGSTPTYLPNSKGAWMDRNEAYGAGVPIEGDAPGGPPRRRTDHYEQPGILFSEDEPRTSKGFLCSRTPPAPMVGARPR